MNINLNKLFPSLSIRKKLIIAFTLLSSVPIVLIGLLGLYNNINTLEQAALENLQHEVDILQERTRNFLTNVEFDIRYLCSAPVFKRFLDNFYQDKKPANAVFYNLVVQQFLNFARTKNIYYQLHFIDKTGKQIFKIEADAGNFRVVPKEQLSERLFRFYFLLSDSLSENQTSFIPVELSDPGKKKISAISYAHRIYSAEGKFFGIFIADIFAKDFFAVLENRVHFDAHRKFAIVNSEGYYLYHSEKKKNWNQLLATRDTNNLPEEYSREFSGAVLSGQSGIISGSGEIAAYTPLFTAPFHGSNSYFLFESVERDSVLGPAHRFTYIFITILLIFLAISISAGFIATSQFAGPIRQLKKGAEIISRGNYSHRLNIETNDEIEELAHQFNRMAGAIRERENLLETQQKQLEKMVVQRTAELQNEKEKLQIILDNVPSAFLLLDENCYILSASAAIKFITGHSPNAVLNRKCYQIFSNREICKNCSVNNPSRRRRISAFIETQINSDGESAFIEHVSIPLTLKNKNPAYLEILTDITERKKFEDHLLQTEKLAVTGEMSAVIAHELRNSLTSVKMIFQLLREGRIPLDHSEPLDVAAQSIYRMEEVIDNLLRFARPAPFEFKSQNINSIIEESIQFVKPHLDKKQININKNFDPSITEINLDIHHIREAFINLLLNSIQALEEQGQISLHSELYKLSRKLEDYAYSENKSFDSYNSAPKVILRKGELVVKIEIKDNGPGIPAKNVNKIFDPFFTTKLNGTGLGLTTVKRTINQHGGIIRVLGRLKKGTAFQILLPLKRPA